MWRLHCSRADRWTRASVKTVTGAARMRARTAISHGSGRLNGPAAVLGHGYPARLSPTSMTLTTATQAMPAVANGRRVRRQVRTAAVVSAAAQGPE